MVERIWKAHPEVIIKYDVQPSEHCFDINAKLKDSCLVEGLSFIDRVLALRVKKRLPAQEVKE